MLASKSCILYKVDDSERKANLLKVSQGFNSLTPMSDQHRISPDNINTISSRKVMRIKKKINLGIIS